MERVNQQRVKGSYENRLDLKEKTSAAFDNYNDADVQVKLSRRDSFNKKVHPKCNSPRKMSVHSHGDAKEFLHVHESHKSNLILATSYSGYSSLENSAVKIQE